MYYRKGDKVEISHQGTIKEVTIIGIQFGCNRKRLYFARDYKQEEGLEFTESSINRLIKRDVKIRFNKKY